MPRPFARPADPTTLLTGMAFLGALLSFGMEPLVGRMLTPVFGSAVRVWLTCLMFFQGMLFLGYAYAHLLAPRLGRWHLAILVLPLVNLPFGLHEPPSADASTAAVLLVLLRHFAAPFAVLSTTAVVAQSWLAGSASQRSASPYGLYAASNAGSLLGLLGYPLLVEPFCGVRLQSAAWTAGYLAYALLVALAWRGLGRVAPSVAAVAAGAALTVAPPATPPDAPPDAPLPAKLGTPPSAQPDTPAGTPSIRDYLSWLGLSALPSAFLLAVTNTIAMELGSFPLVWVLPLAAYLGTFIATFRDGGGRTRLLWKYRGEILLIGCLFQNLQTMSWVLMLLQVVVLGAVCLLAHGELYERRPPARHLTRFYLAIALGGWLGGIFGSVAAPQLFSGLYEYPLLIAMFFGMFFLRRPLDAPSSPKPGAAERWARALTIAALLLGVGFGLHRQVWMDVKHRWRNYYGMFSVIDDTEPGKPPLRKLVHNATLHGSELLDDWSRPAPTSYYHAAGNIGVPLGLVQAPRRIAVIGLGTGAIAGLADAGDRIDFYEIDPDIERIARAWFSYLDTSRAEIRVVPGDGRLSFGARGRGARVYDLIIVDAFSGDGIPAHLLTSEAIQTYLAGLAEGGLLLFHISNRFYDLAPVLQANARLLGLAAAKSPWRDIADRRTLQPSICVALAASPDALRPLCEQGWTRLDEASAQDSFSPWTDDYINMLAPLLARILR